MASDAVKHFRLVIELSLWKPQEQQSMDEIDDFINLIREKKLLAHLGNVKTTIEEVKDVVS